MEIQLLYLFKYVGNIFLMLDANERERERAIELKRTRGKERGGMA